MTKKLILIISMLVLFATLLVGCNKPSEEPGPDDNGGDKGKTVYTDGESVWIYGKTAEYNFDIVYPDSDAYVAGAFAGRLYNALSLEGISVGLLSSDWDKPESKLEVVIGETNRAISDEAKAVADAKLEDPNDQCYVILYDEGQLAIYATNENTYNLAYEYLIENHLNGGELKVPSDMEKIEYIPAPHDAIMSYDVPDNFFDGYTDPFGMTDSDYKSMKVTRAATDRYYIDYIVDASTYYRVEFRNTAWGVWRLGKISYIDKVKTHLLCPDSTDYEFVLVCRNEGNAIYRGGNHGIVSGIDESKIEDESEKYNDRLLDITLYDGKTGEKVVLDKVGDSATLMGLRIVMHNNIYEQKYAQENVLINVERSYLFNGFDVFFDAKLYVAQDVKFKNSYSAMMPTYKEYGNCMMLYNMDGTTTYAKTLLNGNGKDCITRGFRTTKVDCWGENNPAYHMTVEVLNPDDQLMSADSENGYAVLRDMRGGVQNKVYFSTFSINETLMWGTELNYKTKYSFSYQPDFKNPTAEPDVMIVTP